MAYAGRRVARADSIWPGFVDAFAALLIVLVFLLLVFTVAQVFLAREVTSRDDALARLSAEIEALAASLSMEKKSAGELERRVADLSAELEATLAERGRLRQELAAARDDAGAKAAAIERAEEEQGRLADRVDLLNRQIAALREQLASIAAALEVSEKESATRQAKIEDLGERLNVALAKRAEELARYRSEFFGRLREVLGDRPDVRVVGDRFVLDSEVLFETASADLEPAGREQLAAVTASLREIAGKIPAEIDWVLRVDGHTDRRPIRTPQFPSNWELSTARALAVVKFMTAEGIPAARLAAAGFAENHPIDPGADEVSLRRNRRIELRLTEGYASDGG
jgi:chemotaxis protein MotB